MNMLPLSDWLKFYRIIVSNLFIVLGIKKTLFLLWEFIMQLPSLQEYT